MSETTGAAAPPETDDLEELPGFTPLRTQPSNDPLDPEATHLEDLSRSPEPPPPGHPPRHAAGETGPGPSGATPSSRTSTDDAAAAAGPDPELEEQIDEALAGLAGGLFMLGGLGVNKVTQRKRPGSTLWVPTQAEAESFGNALGRIAGRRVPEELIDDDMGDLIVAGGTLLGYGMHNALGITGAELEAGAAASAPTYDRTPQAPAPATAPPPRQPARVVQQPPAAPPPAPGPPDPPDVVRDLPAPDDPTTSPPPPTVIDPGL